MVKVVTLSAYGQLLQVVPELGAAISRYAVECDNVWYDFLRPATSQAIAQGDISGVASFLMAPWAGRIQNGRFDYHGKTIHYPSRIAGLAHSMHGFTRDMPWQIVEQTQDCLVLRFVHQATEEWPFSFDMVQTYHLTEDGLSIDVEVQNTGLEVMPFSMGHHPFFPIEGETKLYAHVQQAWFSDDELMPTHLDNHPLVQRLAMGYPVQEASWDTIFTGWDKSATIEWSNRRLSYTVSTPMDFFVLYNPTGETWFCAEPFGNITDSFNLREKFPRQNIGGLDIAAGNKLKTYFCLKPAFY